VAKFINISQITGEKGVAAFHDYCVNHNPPIIWREETKNDFGIDGEIEITRKHETGKIEVTGEILKVQIKSTETGSYISNNDDISFKFNAKKNDIEYWKKHKLSVVLVIYIVNSEELYAKKVDKIDFELSKKKFPIIFNKEKNQLIKGESNFLVKFSDYFKERVNFDTKELLFTNIFCFTRLPKFVYEYSSLVSNINDIFESNVKRYPEFILYSSKIYSFTKLEKYPEFYQNFIECNTLEQLYFKRFLREKKTRNFGIELINKYFKSHCYEKGIGYNKDYKRFYFKKFTEEEIEKKETKSYVKRVFRVENYIPKSGKRKSSEREVVTSYVYYNKTAFIRHFAFETYYFLNEDNLYLTITPKYLFTVDGKEVLEDKKKVTKYTNYMTSREMNQQVLNHIYFIFQYLSENKEQIILANFGNCNIAISKMKTFQVNFGIGWEPEKKFKQTTKKLEVTQKNLFD